MTREEQIKYLQNKYGSKVKSVKTYDRNKLETIYKQREERKNTFTPLSQFPKREEQPLPEMEKEKKGILKNIKDFFISDRGFADTIEKAEPTTKDQIVGATKWIGETANGLISLPSLAIEFAHRKLGDEEGANEVKRMREGSIVKELGEITAPKTPEEARVMKQLDVIDIATMPLGFIKSTAKTSKALDKLSKLTDEVDPKKIDDILKENKIYASEDIINNISKTKDTTEIADFINEARKYKDPKAITKKTALDEVFDVVTPEKVSKIQQIKEAPAKTVTKLQEAFTTRFAPLKKFDEETLQKAGIKTSDNDRNSLMKSFENYSSARARAGELTNKFKEEVIDRVSKTASREEFNAFLFLERTKSRIASGVKTGTFTPEKIEEASNELLEKLGANKYKELTLASQKIQKYADDSLKRLRDSGILSKEGYETIKKRNDFYATFKVMKHVGDDDFLGHSTRSLNMSKQDVVKVMKGISDEEFKLADILDETTKKIYQSHLAAEKNKIMSLFGKLSDVDGSGVKKLKASKEKAVASKNKDLVHYMEDGKVKFLEVDKDIARAIKGLNYEQAGFVSKMGQLALIPARAGITTYNVGFITVNAGLDLARLGTISKFRIKSPQDTAVFLYDYITSLAESIGGNYDSFIRKATGGKISTASTTYKKAKEEGAFISTIYNSYLSNFAEKSGPVSRYVHKTLDIFDKFGNSIEETAKLAGYKRGLRELKKGKMSHEELLYEVRNYAGSPDFSRGGTLTPGANVLFMFFNARLQGIASDARRLSGYSDGGKEALKSATILSIPAMAITYNTVINNTMYKEDYEKLTDWEKTNNIIIFRNSFIKDENGNYVYDAEGKPIRDAWRIPIRDTIGSIKNLVETIVDSAYQDKSLRESLIAYTASSIEGFSPVNITGESGYDRFESIISSTNPLIKASYEIASGRDPFRHKDIKPEYIRGAKTEDLPEELQYKTDTPKWAIRLGEITGISPLMIEKVSHDFGSGVFTQFQSTDQRGNALTRRFIRSEYYKQNEEMLDYLRTLEEGQAIETIDEYTKAWTIYNATKNLTKEEKKIAFKELIETGEVTEGVFERVVKFNDYDRFGYSEEDQKLRNLQVGNGARAVGIAEKLNRLENNKDRKAYLKSLADKKILTDTVFKQVLYLQKKKNLEGYIPQATETEQ